LRPKTGWPGGEAKLINDSNLPFESRKAISSSLSSFTRTAGESGSAPLMAEARAAKSAEVFACRSSWISLRQQLILFT